MTVANRLNVLMARKNMTHAELAAAIGVSRQAVQKWASGSSEPKGTNLARICEFFGISQEWFENGDSNVESVLGAGSHVEPTIEEQTDSVRVLYRRDFFLKHHVNPSQCKRYKVSGDSMEPTLSNGDTVLVVERQERIVDGAVYVFSVRDEMMIKRLYRRSNGSIVIHSDNTDGRYIDEVLTPEDQEREYFRVYGRAIERSGEL